VSDCRKSDTKCLNVPESREPRFDEAVAGELKSRAVWRIALATAL